MDQRLAGLSALKAQRKTRRKEMNLGDTNDNGIPPSNAQPLSVFSETPVEDLLACVPHELPIWHLGSSIAAQNPVHPTSIAQDQSWPTQKPSEAPTCPLPKTPDAVSFVSFSSEYRRDSVGAPWLLPDEDILISEESWQEMLQMTPVYSRNSTDAFDSNWPLEEESELHLQQWDATLEGKTNRNTVSTSIASLSTYLSTSSLKARLPSTYSSLYIKWIARLRKAHSMTNSSAATVMENTHDVSMVDSDEWTIDNFRPISTIVPQQSHVATLLLSGCFLELDSHIKQQGICLPGLPAHDAGTCWCLEELQSRGKLWVHSAGVMGLENRILPNPPEDLTQLHLFVHDAFGNNLAHMLAARGASKWVITQALNYVDGNSKNTADQNFLHLLPRSYLEKELEGSYADFKWFILSLRGRGIRLHDCDVFGRSFFHILTRQAAETAQLSRRALEYFKEEEVKPYRDAFGWLPTMESANELDDDTRFYLNKLHYSSQACCGAFGEQLLDVPDSCAFDTYALKRPTMEKDSIEESSPSDTDIHILKNARLLKTARFAFDTPDTEDCQGRNGLQCLAEASLTLTIDLSEVPAGSSQKRKRDQADGDPSSTRLKLRHQLVQGLLDAGVNANNYDKSGNAVLMAFISCLEDGEDDKTLAKLLHDLIARGANINRRNRHGESALHIAVRLGRKVATKVLLETGANVHARTIAGKGVLAVGETHYFRARHNPALYASIMACLALCIQHGAVAAPTLVQEWTMNDGGFI